MNRTFPDACGGGPCTDYESLVEAVPGGFSFTAGIGSSDFAIPHWKVVSEGDDFRTTANRCARDIAPEAPLAGFCAWIDADPAKDCTLVRHPAAPHCSAYWTRLPVDCLDWFERL